MDQKFAIAITTMFFSRVYMESVERHCLHGDLDLADLADIQAEVLSVFSSIIERTIADKVDRHDTLLAGTSCGQKTDSVDWSLVVELDDGLAMEQSISVFQIPFAMPLAHYMAMTH